MAHIHDVVDTDIHYKINGVTRDITNVNEVKRTLVQGDHNSERFTFEIPRYIDGHDLTTCNCVEVHYINIDMAGKEKNEDIYDIEDMGVKEDDESVVIFTWLIDGNATRYAGTINFIIKFSCIDEQGNVNYVWNTLIFKSIFVSDGICNSNAIAERYSDIMKQWEAKLFGDSKEGVENIYTARDSSLEAIELVGNEMYDRLYAVPISIIPDTLEANKEYNFGEVTELALAFPTLANKGDVIYLTFKSGEVATTLTIDTTNTTDIEVIPEANCYYDIFAKFNGSVWLVNYSEYLVSEV